VTPRGRVALVWVVLGTVVAVSALVLWRPMVVAWRCYRMHENGARAETELVRKLDGLLVLRFTSGPLRDQACTAKTSAAHYESLQTGDPLEVVTLDDRPGECVLVATVENSGLVLWSISGVLFFGLLLALALGLWLQRTFTRPEAPRRRMLVDRMTCPGCGKEMEEGYVPLVAGLHWREIGEPVGLPSALRGLPGTVGWRERPRLHSFRCQACELLTLQYGQPFDPASASAPR
jgi:hypothetical protein